MRLVFPPWKMHSQADTFGTQLGSEGGRPDALQGKKEKIPNQGFVAASENFFGGD